RVELLDQVPFKAQNRYSAVRVRCGSVVRLLVLGAWDALRTHLDQPAAEHGEKIWQELLPTGLRLLLFAEASSPQIPAQGNWHIEEDGGARLLPSRESLAVRGSAGASPSRADALPARESGIVNRESLNPEPLAGTLP